ncbi:MAG: hypothetical protein AB4042_14925 [Leptolyngbyaceae cyanobacterium]
MFITPVRPKAARSVKQRLKETAERIVGSGCITRADEDFLFYVAKSDEVLSSEEIKLVQSIHDRLRMGLLDLVE